MYCVYWMYKGYDMEKHESRHQFQDELKDALHICEVLRNDRNCCFVTLVSENPNSVGKPGVDVTGPDYNWTKRRTTELRFPKE